jgi:hypothetical protein
VLNGIGYPDLRHCMDVRLFLDYVMMVTIGSNDHA